MILPRTYPLLHQSLWKYQAPETVYEKVRHNIPNRINTGPGIFIMIDAKEDMYVLISDIIRAFLHTDDTSGSTHLKFDGIMA